MPVRLRRTVRQQGSRIRGARRTCLRRADMGIQKKAQMPIWAEPSSPRDAACELRSNEKAIAMPEQKLPSEDEARRPGVAVPVQQFRSILDSIADGVFTVDADWRITFFNRAAEQITGVPLKEALGRPCREVFKASICESACALEQTMKTGCPLVNRMVYIVTAGGDRVPISISTALLRDTDGRAIGGVETFRDLSLVERLRKELEGRYSLADIVSKNHEVQRIFGLLPDIASSESTVLIEGESGTGKELFARAVHSLSARKDKPFVVVDCGALPDDLLNSELFGYKAGAFTDAKKDKPGRIALAEGGTVFLDEVATMQPALQVKLLRFLQERTYEPLGGTESVEADVRVVAATNQPLQELVDQGAFRLDLYYRINVVKLSLPPLRERWEDIPLLADHFIAKFNQLRGKDITGLSPEAMAALADHDFPGNVRELENIIEHAFVLCSSGVIELSHLPGYLRKRPSPAVPAGDLEDAERRALIKALERNKWNRAAVAQELGIHKSTLYRKIKAHQIELPATDGRTGQR